MKIGFYGATKEVTGSKHLLMLDNGFQLLLDCGLYQGNDRSDKDKNSHFGFDPRKIDCLVLSHAHIDHSGLIPKLVKDGFKGKIYCTPATRDLCKIMLEDSGGIQESDIGYVNKRRRRDGLPPIEPLYTEEDAQKAMKFFRPVAYDTRFKINSDIELLFTDAGHLPGSACVSLSIQEGDKHIKLAFTGDIGRYTNRILRDPANFPQADYLIAESTYGNRVHQPVADIRTRILEVVHKTCVQKKGKVVIPSFSIGRTQDIVSILNNLEFEGLLPKIKVYVDSPLAVDATDVLIEHSECYNDKFREFMKHDPDPFQFRGLHYIRDVNESKALNLDPEPCIIISASGMVEAGRIKHHVKNNIGDERNTILFVGYCTPSSTGGKILAGNKRIRIFGEEYDVRAEIERIEPFSAHGDSVEMLQFLRCQNPALVKQMFLVHGEEDSMISYKEKLEISGFKQVYIPDYKEIVSL